MSRIFATTWARRKTLALALLLTATLTMVMSGIANAAPATFTVTNTNDSGEGSLRQAITDANANANSAEVDTINFDIPASDPYCDNTSSVCTISPSTELPAITEAVSIDGYSQPGSSPNTKAVGNDADLKVQLSGASAGAADGITMTSPNNVVKGLIINRWSGTGILVDAPGSDGNRIEGNFIGTDASGTQDLGNSLWGVLIEGARNNVVGGTSAGSQNLITGGRYDGVLVYNGAEGNRILRNSIFNNGGLGINLSDNTSGVVTPNDAGDADSGANNLQNYPVITSVTTFNGQTTIQGTLNSTSYDAFDLRFYASPTAEPSGFGEGQTYVGQTNVAANAGGNAAFSFTTNTPISGGHVVTATATNSVTYDTSEFSEVVEVEDTTPPPPPAPQCSDGADNDMDGKTDFGGANPDPGCTSATDDSESPDPTPPDTIAPTVTSVTPDSGATDVLRLTNVTATFSEELDQKTIANNFTLVSKKGKTTSLVPATITLGSTDDGKTVVTLEPSVTLAKGTQYEARIKGGTGGVKDLAGNPLAADKVWSFTTGTK